MRTEAALRRDAARVFRAALKAADPAEGIRRAVTFDPGAETLSVAGKRYRLDKIGRLFVVGAGKASARMAKAVEDILGARRIAGGWVNTKYGHGLKLKRIHVHECGHPVPDPAGIEGARSLARLATDAGERDLALCLISGGASALLPLPAEGISLDDKQSTTGLLLRCGASIHEINCVRKHISAIKGGRLAEMAAPARVISLILSDVIGDDLDVIGSGCTAPDRTTYADALRVLDTYGLRSQAPSSVRQRLEAGARGEIPETPKTLANAVNVIIGSNKLALDAAAAEARTLGYRTLILSGFIEGETRDIARLHGAIAKEIRANGRPLKPPCCIVSGGETTVTIRGNGKGGRNQEFALAGAIEIAGLPNVVLLSGGTDGTDGPTDAAGALSDGRTLERGRHAGLDPQAFLANNDSYHYFAPLGDLLLTGPTQTNVADVRLLLVGPAR